MLNSDAVGIVVKRSYAYPKKLKPEVTLIIPNELKVFMEYVSPAIFKVVSLTDAIKKSAQLVAMLAPTQKNEQIANDAKSKLKDRMPAQLVFKAPNSNNNRPPLVDELDKLTLAQKQDIGETILKLYFEQLKNDQWVFLDLRLHHMELAPDFTSADEQSPSLLWDPSQLLHKFSSSFLHGLHEVYSGFYGDKPEQLEGGLIKLGLLDSESDTAEKEKLISLLLSHFDKGSDGLVLFDLNDFYQSFHQMFLHLKEQKRRLQTDFVFLGIYLVSLYISLEKLGVGLDVRSAWNGSQQ